MLEYKMLEHIAQRLWNLMGGTNSIVFYTLLVLVGCTFVFFKTSFLLKKIVQWVKCIRNLPPGPWGVPIWGYLPFIKGATYLHYYELSKKFGGMFSIRLGSVNTIVISDPRLIREAFKSEEFSGRPHTDFMNIIDGYGIVNTEGDLWKDQRKFLNKKLGILGMKHRGSNKDQQSMDSRIMREVKVLLEELEKQGKASTNLSPFLAVSISNVICSFIMDVRFDYGEMRFKRFMDLIDEGFKLFANLTSANYIPLLRYLPRMNNIRNKISQNRAEMADFFQKVINTHKTTYNENNIRDVLDDYLYEIQKAKNESRDYQLFQGKNKDRQMQQILGDLFSAGMETVKTALEWSIVFMLHYPEAAKAMQDELDQVVGRTRLPSMEDREFLPITEATVQEILRRSNLVPLGTTHATTRDVKLNGYTIPAGSHVIPLLYAMHMNPELWDEPEVFRPSRFLTDEGKIYKPEFFIPFGVGRRKCLGDKLAHMELFLFFSSLMHMFNLSLPESASLPSLNGNVGVTISPKPFEVCLLPRDGFQTILKNSSEVNNNLPQRNIGL